MYLISIYFDKQTEKRLQSLINRVAEVTGNDFMIDNHVPPHITVAAVETKHEDELIACMDRLILKNASCDEARIPATDMSKNGIESGDIQWVSAGAFFPQVIFVQPVLNEYLHNFSLNLAKEFAGLEETMVSPYYQPFGWLPHCTIAKKLTKEQMTEAYEVLRDYFVPMNGRVTKIGVARTNPHRDIKVWELE